MKITGIILISSLAFLVRITQSVVTYTVPQQQIKFLDDFCASISCMTIPLFANWTFTKNQAGSYLSQPCAGPNVQNTWQFIDCSYQTLLLGQTQADANVSSLIVNYPSSSNPPTYLISGTIPKSISNMNSLKNLNLANHDFYGSLPSEIGSCTALEVLNLSNNRISGTIPMDGLLHLNKLKVLYLNGNRLEGSLPAQFTSLSTLTDVNLNDNMLSGKIPEDINNLFLLTALRLGKNRITNTIPASVYTMSNLLILDLNGNLLEGTLSSSLASLSKLQHLELGVNKLQGAVPASLYTMNNLLTLGLEHNFLSGTISSQIGDMPQLQELSLGMNRFDGPLPGEIARLINLKVFDMSYNRLSGLVPTMFNSSYLQVLELGGNAFSGTIPEEVLYPTLTKLALDNNQLTGTIPLSVGVLGNLQMLYLQNNKLQGPIPYSLRRLSSLQILALDGNALTGALDLCGLVETVKSIIVTGNALSCKSSCWKGEAALSTNSLPDCDFCPANYYSEAVPVDELNSSEGTILQCFVCPEGTYSLKAGALGLSSCISCPLTDNPSEQTIIPCRPTYKGGKYMQVGTGGFTIFAFLCTFSFAGLFLVFGVALYRARNASQLTAHVNLVTIIIKMAAHGFNICAEVLLGLALVTTWDYDRLGAALLTLRMTHVIVSCGILAKIKYPAAHVAYAPAPSAEIEDGERETKKSVLPAANSYFDLINHEALGDPKYLNFFNAFAGLCCLESQLLQFMPWRESDATCENHGFPDWTTYFSLSAFKCMQSCMTIILLMTYLGDIASSLTRPQGIIGLFALTIFTNAGILVYASILEPMLCKLCSRKSNTDGMEPSNESEVVGEGAVKSPSLDFDAAMVYGGESTDLEDMNPMQAMAGVEDVPRPKSSKGKHSKSQHAPPAAGDEISVSTKAKKSTVSAAKSQDAPPSVSVAPPAPAAPAAKSQDAPPSVSVPPPAPAAPAAKVVPPPAPAAPTAKVVPPPAPAAPTAKSQDAPPSVSVPPPAPAAPAAKVVPPPAPKRFGPPPPSRPKQES